MLLFILVPFFKLSLRTALYICEDKKRAEWGWAALRLIHLLCTDKTSESIISQKAIHIIKYLQHWDPVCSFYITYEKASNTLNEWAGNPLAEEKTCFHISPVSHLSFVGYKPLRARRYFHWDEILNANSYCFPECIYSNTLLIISTLKHKLSYSLLWCSVGSCQPIIFAVV